MFPMIFLLAVSSLAWSDQPARLRKDLIQPYTFELQNKEPFSVPYYSSFKKGEYKLVYFAINFEENTKAPAQALLAKIIDKFNPRVIVYQGDPKKAYQDPSYCGAELSIISYVECIAQKRDTPLVKSEPEDEALYKNLSRQGVSAEDFFYFYVFRPLASKQPALTVEQSVESKIKQLSFIKKKFSKEGFLTWYSKKMKNEFSPTGRGSNEIAPLEDGTFIQKFAAKLDRFRETEILEKTEAALNKHKTVLVVYASAHLPKQRRALETFFGKPTAERNN